MTSWLTLRALAWLLVLAFVALTVIGAIGPEWAAAWLPNYAAEVAGVLVTVLIVERVVAREFDRRRLLEEEPLRRSVGQRLRLALSPLFVSLIRDYVGSDATAPLPPPIDDPADFLDAAERALGAQRREDGTWRTTRILDPDWAKSFEGAVEEVAIRAEGVADRASRVLTSQQQAAIEAFLSWRVTTEAFRPSSLAVIQLPPDDVFAAVVDEAIDLYLAELFSHARGLVTVCDQLSSGGLSLADEWSSATVEHRLLRAIFELADDDRLDDS